MGVLANEYEKEDVSDCLSVYDLPIKGTRQTPTSGYNCQAGNSQSLSYKHEYELHKSRNVLPVTERLFLLGQVKKETCV